MSDVKTKVFAILKICLAMLGCLFCSLAIYLGSSIFVFAAWHCPPPCERQTAWWIDLTIFLLFLSPLLIFTTGAYLCRNVIFTLTENKFLRVILLLFFRAFSGIFVRRICLLRRKFTNLNPVSI